MANVLAELFQDQANAIREGLGDIGKFPPADFADRIRDIVALIGTGGGSGDSGGTGGGESGGTGGSTGTGTGLKVATGNFEIPDYDFMHTINMDSFAASDRYPGLYIYEVSPAVLPLAVGEAYYLKHGFDLWSPPSGGAALIGALGIYSNCYAVGNVHFVNADYSGPAHDDSCPYLLLYDESNNRNIILLSIKYPNSIISFVKLGSFRGVKTIAHGMSMMPDFIYVHHDSLAEAITEGPPGNALMAAAGVKSDFADYFENGNLGFICYASGGGWIDTGIDDYVNAGSSIRCRNDTTFSIGSSNTLWYPDSSYTWVAISGLGSSGGGEVIIEGVDPYYQQLAEAMMVRNAKYLGDAEVLNLKSFKTSSGGTLASLNDYSFAGFNKVTGMVFSDIILVYENALRDCSNLKYLDITTSSQLDSIGFLPGSLTGCTALEAVIIRDGGGGIASAGLRTDVGGNDTFYVYVPSTFFDEIVAGLASSHIAASRYRKLEDYPLINFWNETFTVEFYDGETLLNTVEVKCGESVSYTPEKENAVFTGWVPSPTEVVSNMKCHAQWLIAHTVRFWDGDTLLETVVVEDGGSATFSYEKEGYNFFGWSQEAVNVTEDMDIYGDWQMSFADAPWEQIVANSDAGKAGTYYALGDTKAISFTDPNGVARTGLVKIIGFGIDTLADGTGTAGITVMTTKTLFESAVQTSDGVYPGWPNCALRTNLHNRTFNSLPEALRNGIKDVVKKSRKYVNGTDATGLYVSNDKLWIPSVGDFGMSTVNSGYGVSSEGKTGYTGVPSRTSEDTYGTSTTSHILTRSASYTNKVCIMSMRKNTSVAYTTSRCDASLTHPVLVGFCI